MRITAPLGTSLDALGMAGVIAGLRASGHEVRVVAGSADVDGGIAAELFAGLDLRVDTHWATTDDGVSSDISAIATDEFARQPPDAVLLIGDSEAVVAAALAARRGALGVVHVQAGLRSFDECAADEINRALMVALATIHLAPTELAAAFLREGGVPGARIRVVGSPLVDMWQASGVTRVPTERRAGILMAVSGNTNDAAVVGIATALGDAVATVTLTVPARLAAQLRGDGLWDALAASPEVRTREDVAYGAQLRALTASQLLVTDIDSFAEAASYFGVPVVMLHSTTARWEGVVNGSMVLTGADVDRVTAAARQLTGTSAAARIAGLACPYGDGRAVSRVIDAFADEELMELLLPAQPDYRYSPPPLPAGF